MEKAIDWDEKLPPEIQEKWASLFREILNLNDISFERRLTPPDAIGLPAFVSFLMLLRKPSVPAHMYDGSCLMENSMFDLLLRNQEWHH